MTAPRALTLAAHDLRPTRDVVRCALLGQQAAAYRAAARDLLDLADEMEREARDGAYLANVQADADAELMPLTRGRRR